MSVDDWAREQALAGIQHDMNDAERAFWIAGDVAASKRLADALLSDEAVRAAARALTNYEPQLRHFSEARIALQAAVDAVTKEARGD
ncbi:hypothetical protein Pan2_59 [Pseudanabaena phage Pan2]|nr:hypothetical protein Pan2_59 [Pseudanabaena phage Pan2]